MCCARQGTGHAQLRLASPTLEALSLSFKQLLPSKRAPWSLPQLTDMIYNCDIAFTSVFKELPALQRLRVGAHCKVR